MNRIVAVLGFLAFISCAGADLSWGHTHQAGLPEQEIASTMFAKPVDCIGAVVNGADVLQLTEQTSWNWLNLAHTDPHHIHSGEPYRPSLSQHSYAPDGAAVMFGWTFDRP